MNSVQDQFKITYKNLKPPGNMRVSTGVVYVDLLRET